MSTTTQPTTRGISTVLRKAGFTKSQSSGTRIRGVRNHSEGFGVRGWGPDEVRVWHQTGQFHPSDADYAAAAEMEERYARAIEAAGYAVERREGGYFGAMRVTAQAAA